MGGGDVSQSSTPKTYTQLFNELCPYYLSYGMTYEQFWYGDPQMAGAFRKKFRLEQERKNFDAWLQGFYIYNAFGVCLSNVFRTKGSKADEYMQKPIDLYPKKLTEEELEDKQEKDAERMAAQLESMFKTMKKE